MIHQVNNKKNIINYIKFYITFHILAISKNNFSFHYIVGRGGFGKVFFPSLIKIKNNLRFGKLNSKKLNLLML